jgi:hypothetical protein
VALRLPFRKLQRLPVAAKSGDWRAVADMLNRNFEEIENTFSDRAYTVTTTATTTAPTLGTGGSTTGRYLQAGSLVIAEISTKFGTAGVAAGSGSYLWNLPVVPKLSSGGALYTLGGHVELWDFSGSIISTATPEWDEATQKLWLRNSNPASTTALIGAAVPWTWAASDEIQIRVTYIARNT